MPMIPGDKTVGRYRGRRTLSAAILALIAAGAGTPAIYQQFLAEKEGTRLVAYQDGKGIWTICQGLTRIYERPVVKSDKLSATECSRLDAAEQSRGLLKMQSMVRPEIWATLPPAARSGVASFCVHNIGASKCSESTFLKELNAGRRNSACGEITKWIKDNGKDCRDRANGCSGQPIRRQQEDELCLEGFKP